MLRVSTLPLLAAMAMGLALFASTAGAQPQPPPPGSTMIPAPGATITSAEFVEKVGQSGLYEISAASIALRSSRDPQVRAFARLMMRDHSRLDAQLIRTVGRTPGLRVPTRLDDTHRELLTQLRTAPRDQFNNLYVAQQVQAHEDAVALLANYAQHGSHPLLRRFAAQALPIIQTHLRMARQLPTTGPAAAFRSP